MRWVEPAFFIAWTLAAGLVAWWLWVGAAGKPGLLIALSPGDNLSLLGRVRRWVEVHVEAAWVYPWILLGPHVVWLGWHVTLERRGWLWRCGIHLLAAAGFVLAAETLTSRVVGSRPRAVFLRHEDVVRSSPRTGAPGSLSVEVRERVEWRDGRASGPVGSPMTNMLAFGIARAPEMGTNQPAASSGSNREVVMLQARMVGAGPSGQPATNWFLQASVTNVAVAELATQLAPLLEEHLGGFPPPPALTAPRVLSAALDSLAYIALVGLAQAVHFRRRFSERERHAALLEARLTQSRLHALQAQLQPHFLFNTLNGIALLVRREPRVAEQMLIALSDLLRLSLAQSAQQELPLRDELAFLDRYLELQQMRFGDRLRVEHQVDPAALECLVPSLILQPLAENAIRHGIEPSPHPGLIRVTARREERRLWLSIQDIVPPAEPGTPATVAPGNGVGLRSVRERLAGLYGEDHEFACGPHAGHGFEVRLAIPARTAAPPDGASTQPATA
jgi:hypothetical protein